MNSRYKYAPTIAWGILRLKYWLLVVKIHISLGVLGFTWQPSSEGSLITQTLGVWMGLGERLRTTFVGKAPGGVGVLV